MTLKSGNKLVTCAALTVWNKRIKSMSKIFVSFTFINTDRNLSLIVIYRPKINFYVIN